MSKNNIPHVVDQGASIMPHERMKPLTDVQIKDIWYRHPMFKDGLGVDPVEFARAIEKVHGIE